jgi:steroid 5-alpha reductase family enzyme
MSALLIVVVIVWLALAMTFAWAVRLRTGQSGWIDTIWSAATGLAGIFVALTAASSARPWLAAGLILVWGARLAAHIGGRTRGAGDDPRYAALEREWGADFSRRLFQFLQIQGAASWPLVLAIAIAARSPRPFPDAFDLAGVVVAAAGLAGEAISDAQMSRYRRTSPRGGICESGLWRYSRHPNYFFEVLFWCAWPFIAFDPADPLSLLAFAAPAFMYGLLVYVSGVPPLEKHMRESRGAAFDAYARRVNRFFPGPPRRD